MTTGEIIKAERKKAGLTQVELGKKIGVSGSMIGQWENNLRNPKNESILKLGSVLGDSFIRALEAESIENLPWQFFLKVRGYSDEEADNIVNDLKKREAQLKENIKIFIDSEDGQFIIEEYFRLNDRGRQEASQRISELTYVPIFTDQELSNLAYELEESVREDEFKKKYNIAEKDK